MRNPKDLFDDVQKDIYEGSYKAALEKLNKHDYSFNKAEKNRFYLLKARTLLKLNRFQESLEAVSIGLKSNPNSPELLFEKASYYVAIRDYSTAKDIYADLKKKYPNKIKNHLTYIDCLIKEKKYEEAIKHYSSLIDTLTVDFKEEEHYIFFHGIANCYRDMGNYEKAISWYKILINNDPKKKEYIQSMATCLYYKGDAEEAIECYQQIIKDHSASFVTHLSLAQAWGKVDLNEAIKKFNEVIENFSDMPNVYNVYGRFLQSHNRKQEAMDVYKLGLKNHPNDEKLQVSYTFFLLADEKIEEAENQFIRLIENNNSITRDVYLGYALCLAKQEKWEEIIDVLLNKKSCLRYKEICLCLSIAYYSQNDLDQAEYYAREAVEIDKGYHSAWSQLGHIYGMRGESAREFHYFDRARQHWPTRLDKHRSPQQGIEPLVSVQSVEHPPPFHQKEVLNNMIVECMAGSHDGSNISNQPIKQKATLQLPSISEKIVASSSKNSICNDTTLHDNETLLLYEELQLEVSAKMALCQYEKDFKELENKISILMRKAQVYFDKNEYGIAFEKMNCAIELLGSKLEISRFSKVEVAAEKVENPQPKARQRKKKNKKEQLPKAHEMSKQEMTEEEELLLLEAIEENKINRENQAGAMQKALNSCISFFSSNENSNPPIDKKNKNKPSKKIR